MVRLILLVALPFEALVGYGDYQHFFNLAQLSAEGPGGLPFIGHWVEFPPLFPYLSLALHRLSGGSFPSYAYSMALLMLVFDVGNLWLLGRIGNRLLEPAHAQRVTWMYMAFLALPAFGWWTFEPMAVFFMLLCLWYILGDQAGKAGVAAGLGVLTKLIPALPLLIPWMFRSWRKALVSTGIALAVVLVGVLPLLIKGPEMTLASLRSQASKGSWQTIWALVDGNFGTGNFGPLVERLDPVNAIMEASNPERIPSWSKGLVAAALLLWVVWKVSPRLRTQIVPMLTLSWCILLLWSSGWSPQWLSYIVPLILLSLTGQNGAMLALILVLGTLLEWPVLLSRGRVDAIWIPILLRTGLLTWLGIEAFRIMKMENVDLGMRGED